MLEKSFIEKFNRKIRDSVSLVVKDVDTNGLSIENFTQTIQAIRNDISGEYDAIRLYEEHILLYTQLLEETQNSVYQKLIDLTQDIIKEEERHVGELNELLNKVDPQQMQNFEDGVREAQEKLNGKESNTTPEIQDTEIWDERLSPMTYKKLKEMGYTREKWKTLTQEQANKIIHRNTSSASSEGTVETPKEETKSSNRIQNPKPFNPRKPMERYTRDDGTFDTDLMEQDLDEYISPQLKESHKQMIDTYVKSIKQEPRITRNLQEALSETGMKFVGFENRIKSPKSFSDKLRGKPADEHVYDNIRYTLSYSGTDDIIKAQKRLQDMGYEVVKQSNYWLKPNSSYKGINTNVRTPDGTVVEIQYHTPEDLEVKEKNHPYYEEQREALKRGDMNKFFEMEEVMRRNTSSLQEPENIQSLRSFNTLDD